MKLQKLFSEAQVKFHWDEDTILHFRNMLSFSIVDTKLNIKYYENKRVNNLISEFVNNDCELEDGEKLQVLIKDLTKQVYLLK